LPLESQYWQVGKESLHCAGSQQSGEKVDAYPKANSQLPTREQELFKGCFSSGRRALHAEQQSAPTVLLELVMQWSDQRLLDYFRYS